MTSLKWPTASQDISPYFDSQRICYNKQQVIRQYPLYVVDCPRRLSTDSDVSNGSGISEASGGTAVISDVNTGSVFNESNDHIEATFDVSTESGINKGSGSTGVIADMNSGSDFIESNDHIGATSDVSTESGISEGSGGTAVIADMPTETDFNENNDHTGATFDVSTESGISEGSGGTGMTFDMSTGCGISENSGSIGVADDVSTRSGSSEGSDDTGFTSDVSTGSDSIEGNDGTGINPKSSGGRFVLRATPMRHRSRASRKRISTRVRANIVWKQEAGANIVSHENIVYDYGAPLSFNNSYKLKLFKHAICTVLGIAVALNNYAITQQMGFVEGSRLITLSNNLPMFHFISLGVWSCDKEDQTQCHTYQPRRRENTGFSAWQLALVRMEAGCDVTSAKRPATRGVATTSWGPHRGPKYTCIRRRDRSPLSLWSGSTARTWCSQISGRLCCYIRVSAT